MSLRGGRRPFVVVSRSCPPDVGGYQRQLELVLPVLGEDRQLLAVGAVREHAPRPHGWSGVRTIAIPAYRLPRHVRGAADPLIAIVALLLGLWLRISRGDVGMLLLSPTMLGGARLVRLWDRRLGPVVMRVPGAGDARRVGALSECRRTVGIGPGPAQLAEIAELGIPAATVRNAVLPGRRSSGHAVVAVVGRLISTKRVDRIIEAWGRRSGTSGAAQLSIVGSGQSDSENVEPQLRSMVSAGISNVLFHGEVADVWSVVGDAAALVTASEREGSPNAVLEALAHGIPILAPTGSMATWFDPTPPHLEFDDTASLVAQLQVVLHDRARWEELALASTEYSRRYHDLAEIARAWTSLLDRPDPGLTAGWSRTRIPVSPTGLVLDVGSGRYPNARADVLCERDPVRGQRRAVIDRPFVVADAAALPFRSGAFEVAIASHLLEHVDRPEQVLDELSRVASSGFVETPHRRFERWSPESGHLWAVEVGDGALRLERNRWAGLAGIGVRRWVSWIYYAGEQKESPTLRLPGPAGRLLKWSGRAIRGVLNRLGVTTARYRFDSARPPRVERR